MLGDRHSTGHKGSVHLETLPLSVQQTGELECGPQMGAGLLKGVVSSPARRGDSSPASPLGCREGSVRFCPQGTRNEGALLKLSPTRLFLEPRDWFGRTKKVSLRLCF